MEHIAIDFEPLFSLKLFIAAFKFSSNVFRLQLHHPLYFWDYNLLAWHWRTWYLQNRSTHQLLQKNAYYVLLLQIYSLIYFISVKVMH